MISPPKTLVTWAPARSHRDLFQSLYGVRITGPRQR